MTSFAPATRRPDLPWTDSQTVPAAESPVSVCASFRVGTALLPPPVALVKTRVRWSAALRILTSWCYWLTALTLCAGIGQESPVLLTWAALFASLGFLLSDGARAGRGGLTAITVFSLSSLGTAIANLAGLWAMDTARRDLYFIYVADDHLLFAQQLQFVQTVLPVLGFWLVSRHATTQCFFDFIPHIESRINLRFLMIGGAAVSAIVMLLDIANQKFHGTPMVLLAYVPIFAAFTLGRIGTGEGNETALRVGAAIAILECLRALFFGFLRGTIAFPLFAFVGGAILGARSLRPLKHWIFLPIVVAGAMFVWYYGLLGESRQRHKRGWEKVTDMAVYQSRRFDSPDAPPQQTMLVRLTSFNQLSQIGRLVEKNGFYDGRTLEYLRYAFIPRFLWPEKPRIALGAWYALEIGQAVPTADGWYNTSINMSLAGELYLNYGWLAVLLGLLVYGAFYGILWTRTRFWEQGTRNVLGDAFAVALMGSLVIGAYESAVLVTLVAIYICLFMLAVGFGFGTFLFARLKALSHAHGQWWRALPFVLARWR